MNKIISFCLWGSLPKYTIGAIKNAELAKTIYPDWTCRYYVGSCVPENIINKLSEFSHVELIKMNVTGSWNSMFWRFYSISDPNVDIMLSRDCDSRLSLREKECVDRFINSDSMFHSMLDHPFHGGIMGGMWGAKKGILGNMKEMIDCWSKTDAWQTDQSFLNTIIRPLVENTILVHDSINLKNFPSKREDYRFVGEVYDANDNRYEHWVIFTFPEFKHLS